MMTWQEYLEEQIAAGANEENALNAIGRMMDLYESWDWDAELPFDPHESR